jgi:hypothetical protein
LDCVSAARTVTNVWSTPGTGPSEDDARLGSLRRGPVARGLIGGRWSRATATSLRARPPPCPGARWQLAAKQFTREHLALVPRLSAADWWRRPSARVFSQPDAESARSTLAQDRLVVSALSRLTDLPDSAEDEMLYLVFLGALAPGQEPQCARAAEERDQAPRRCGRHLPEERAIIGLLASVL